MAPQAIHALKPQETKPTVSSPAPLLPTVLNAGDIIAIGSGSTACIGVNPLSYRATGKVRTFVVTAPAVSDGGGNCTIRVHPGV